MNKPRSKATPAPAAGADADAVIDLEKSLGELEAIVEQLESGQLPLDQSLKEFERGVRLSRQCQGALKDAEQRVQVLMGGELRDFPGTGPAPDDEPEPDDEAP
ncbi:MAG: exodeoxyribonuclease VII small subunit [Gammaproteobacteria bacterium]|jgi:exodeoxyribonuclease VII small subunit|nr:exodeoxyribonuclease VII small subunit [Gammaproteobacteria bacterium]